MERVGVAMDTKGGPSPGRSAGLSSECADRDGCSELDDEEAKRRHFRYVLKLKAHHDMCEKRYEAAQTERQNEEKRGTLALLHQQDTALDREVFRSMTEESSFEFSEDGYVPDSSAHQSTDSDSSLRVKRGRKAQNKHLLSGKKMKKRKANKRSSGHSEEVAVPCKKRCPQTSEENGSSSFGSSSFCTSSSLGSSSSSRSSCSCTSSSSKSSCSCTSSFGNSSPSRSPTSSTHSSSSSGQREKPTGAPVSQPPAQGSYKKEQEVVRGGGPGGGEDANGLYHVQEGPWEGRLRKTASRSLHKLWRRGPGRQLSFT